MKPHDPNDFKPGQFATEWEIEFYCYMCESVTTHEERISGICLSCGSNRGPLSLLGNARRSRYVFNGGTWITQRVYDLHGSGSYTGIHRITTHDNLPILKKCYLYASSYHRPLFMLVGVSSFVVAVLLCL